MILINVLGNKDVLFIYLFIYPCIHISSIQLFIHHSFIHSFTQSSFILRFILSSFVHSSFTIHSFMHSLMFHWFVLVGLFNVFDCLVMSISGWKQASCLLKQNLLVRSFRLNTVNHLSIAGTIR